MVLKGISKAGLGDIRNDEQYIRQAASLGFEAVDFDAQDFVEAYGLEKAKKILSDNQVVLGSIALPVEWRGTKEEFNRDLLKLPSAAKAAQDLGCTRCMTYILPSTDEPSAQFMAASIYRLRVCAEILAVYDLKLGLEYVGPKHLRSMMKNPFIWTQEETLAMIQAIGSPNVGLVLDSYHWYTNGMDTEDITSLTADQIIYVHLNDAPSIPIDEVKDNERLYPGEGVIDLKAFLKAVTNTGYTGPVTQEVLRAVSEEETVEELLQRSATGYKKVFQSIQ
ncbi:sugar phosphate isomerase/epimerase family protein [Jeotgalibacillus terrae]|uniref:Sugar phosphate isomerase/epimerase family protein n=1 Tax=Jeotgalibacillus terrae TaxID=587735 RepID=A0ABW5ZID0_9BACL|nr:sugar phosphate isomerase/epimerase family protein [Jeotgalibacillus terrae]MBM7579635.1 sugar phosphate isomerase/epimerase [Jeotgalibacillus terrae]